MKVLVACEESQTVCKAFRSRGHEAYSCDIQTPSGGHPEWHILGDAIEALRGGYVVTMDMVGHEVGRWDLVIAHPPCTYLTVTGNAWFNTEKYGKKAEKRWKERVASTAFFMQMFLANSERIAVENPVSIMSSVWRKPDQIIQPYQFGDAFEKKTCLWLKGLKPLSPTNVVKPPERRMFASGKTMPEWYAELWHLPKEERAKARSKTFQGIADAMADQWGGLETK